MAAVGGILLGIGSLVGGGATVYGAVKAGEAQDEQRAAIAEQGATQKKSIEDAKTKQAETERKQAELQARQAASQQRRQDRARSGATRATVLTTPLGVQDEYTGGRKTVLGG